MHLWWQSWGRLTAIIAGSLAGGLLLFVVFCLVTPPGHAVLAGMIGPLSGGSVAIEGLSGGLPNHIRARKVVLKDTGGVWLSAENVVLDWHFLSVIGNHVNVERLHATRVVVFRRQIPKPTTTTSTTITDVKDLAVPRIELMPAVLGRRAMLAASGSLHYASRHDVTADLSVRRLDGVGRYEVHGGIVHDVAHGTLTISESGEGVAGGAIGMPDIGALSLEAQADAHGNSNTIRFKASANLLDISGGGILDLASNQADIDFSAVSPAMYPNKQLSWQVLSARGHLHGPFAKPDISADLKITDLDAAGNRIGTLTANVRGAGGNAELRIAAAGLRLSGEKAGVFAATPVIITAEADLTGGTKPVIFAVEHPLLKLSGRTILKAPMSGNVSLRLPALDRLQPLTGAALAGSATLAVDFKQAGTGGQLDAKGRIAAAGDSGLAKLLGNKADLTATVSMRDPQNLSLRASLKGAAANAQLDGAVRGGIQDFSADVRIADLSRAVSTLVGDLILHAKLTGPQNNGVLVVDGAANTATKGMKRQAVSIAARANGLPKLKAANLRLSGRFDGSPLSVKADVAEAGPNTLKIALNDASWRSARATGNLTVAGSAPRGTIALRIPRLADLDALVGAPLAGSVEARTELSPSSAVIHATGSGLTSGSANIGRIELNGTVANPLSSPVLALTLSVPEFSSSAVSGSAEATLNGPTSALTIALKSGLTTSNGQQLALTADTLVDTPDSRATINRFEMVWRDQTFRLANPSTIDFRDGLKFAATFVDGKSAQLTVAGFVPSKSGQSMNVKANGTADLAVLGSGLASVGQSVRGKLALNVTVTGTAAKPNVVGNATLTGGQLQDYARGLNLTDMEAQIQAQGSTIRLATFKAAAGPGTITGSGTVDLSAPGMPVNIVFKGENARPIVSDLLTAYLDTDLTLKGNLSRRVVLSGQVRVRKGNINIPEKYPAEVATLNVRRPHQAPGPAPSAPLRIALDLTVSSQGRIFVRGRGLEAEFEGDLKVNGNTNNPQVQGALSMRRGTLSIAGANLTFQSGTISFNGRALRRKLDPSLDLTAQTESNGITATLKVTGTASQPKIELSSSPPMPQDEILAQLLFQQSAKSLSAMQLASVAQAAASLGGGGGGFDPVGAMRKSLGLDRLAVGSTPSANGGSGSTTVEAGKYILRNVYLGAKQDLSGGTRALIQVDITKHLKAQAQVNTGPRAARTTSTPLQDNGDSIGVSYQFDY